MIVTRGFEDLLRIRDQRRPHLFKLNQELPVPVFQRAVGIRERVSATGEVIESLDEEEIAMLIESLRHESVEVVAVALLNGYANPVHEKRLGKLLREAGIRFVSVSTELASSMRLLPRAETAAANAYLAPVMDRFVTVVGSRLGEGSLELLTSAGFLKGAEDYRPIDSLLSGPAGGVMGALSASRVAGYERILAFDMGGTSTDVARLEGAPSFRYEQAIGPVRVVAPAVRIETVAAGGGSICRWRNGGMEVGPESAGADPGPACYGRGGPLTITDVNLLLGCMETGKAGIPLEVGASQDRLEALKKEMQRDGVKPAPDQDLLEGLREIAVERMAEAIRKVSLREGYDP
ncbi:MAG: hydantoinase/oxoprolinase family protein, partial [Roseibacillus sp.]|nr:hydantoinase/oxoprolinase family protein [Roseibacillus sp.]